MDASGISENFCVGYMYGWCVSCVCMCSYVTKYVHHVWMNMQRCQHMHESPLIPPFLGQVLTDVCHSIRHQSWMVTFLGSPVSAPHLTKGSLRLWTHATMLSYTCVIGIWTWVLIHTLKAFYILSHLSALPDFNCRYLSTAIALLSF